MSIDRRRLLLSYRRARRIMADPRLPADVKALAKKAADHAQVALELDSAIGRKSGQQARVG